MICTRCHGLLVVDSFIGGLGDLDEAGTSYWACVNCGNHLDRTVILNRTGLDPRPVRQDSPTSP